MKIIPQLNRQNVPVFKYLQAVLHLTHYAVHPFMLMLSLLTLPILIFVKVTLPPSIFIPVVIGMALATSGPSSMYMVAQHYLGRGKGKSLLMIPAMMLIGVGLAVNNTKAVLEAVLHRESPFYRTPKKGESARLHQQKYRPVKDITPVLELLFGVYCLVCFELFVTHCSIFISPFLVMYAAGFLFVGILSVIHYRAPELIDYKLKRRVLARTAA